MMVEQYEDIERIVHTRLKMLKIEHENVVKRLKDKIFETEKKFGDFKEVHHNIIEKLKDKIECPVCMEIPRSGPVPVCPNGHFVCPLCKMESCPTCRSNMGSNMSLLAGTIIDNIEHKCKFEDCDQSFLLTDLVKHEESCSHRSVICPLPSCAKKITLSKLKTHLIDDRTCSQHNTLNSVKQNNCIIYEFLNDDVTSWGLDTFSFDDVDFAVFPTKLDGRFYIMIVMFGTPSECFKYRVELEVHEYTEKNIKPRKISFKCSGNPISIDLDKKELDALAISERYLRRIVERSEDKTPSFCVSFSVSKEE